MAAWDYTPDSQRAAIANLASIMAVAEPPPITTPMPNTTGEAAKELKNLGEPRGRSIHHRYAGPPLSPGSDRQTVGHNIKMMMAQGISQNQAVATALEHAGIERRAGIGNDSKGPPSINKFRGSGFSTQG